MSEIKQLRATTRALRDRLNRRAGERDQIERVLTMQRGKAEEYEAKSAKLSEAIEVLQTASETRRLELKERVDALVTRGLQAVFGSEDYEFSFDVTLAGGRFGVVPMITTNFKGQPRQVQVKSGRGGGIRDVAGFLLRVIVLSLARPRVAPVMVLDEAFAHVDQDRLPGVATLLKELSESAGVQFVLVTHKAELQDAADVIYRATLNPDGVTELELVHDLEDEIYHRAPRRGDEPRDRSTLFDHEDLGQKETGEVVLSENPNAEAKRSRRRRLKK